MNGRWSSKLRAFSILSRFLKSCSSFPHVPVSHARRTSRQLQNVTSWYAIQFELNECKITPNALLQKFGSTTFKEFVANETIIENTKVEVKHEEQEECDAKKEDDDGRKEVKRKEWEEAYSSSN
jgi:hypothetical protein